ncbi:MAG: hypothetical protein H3C58_12985 [Fimbriimonadaceae bacterium]|nr:hypothetical protein [Fimbriimonadaceae bacterium]
MRFVLFDNNPGLRQLADGLFHGELEVLEGGESWLESYRRYCLERSVEVCVLPRFLVERVLPESSAGVIEGFDERIWPTRFLTLPAYPQWRNMGRGQILRRIERLLGRVESSRRPEVVVPLNVFDWGDEDLTRTSLECLAFARDRQAFIQSA